MTLDNKLGQYYFWRWVRGGHWLLVTDVLNCTKWKRLSNKEFENHVLMSLFRAAHIILEHDCHCR